MKRWAIALDGEVRRRLSREQLELGTEVVAEDGTELLVFRDRFVCLRVARSVGTTIREFTEPATVAAV